MPQTNQVEKIIEYLKAKIANLKEKQSKYETPIMQEMVRNSQSLQQEYSRLQARIDEIEDNLLAIEKFSTPEKMERNAGKGKK